MNVKKNDSVPNPNSVPPTFFISATLSSPEPRLNGQNWTIIMLYVVTDFYFSCFCPCQDPNSFVEFWNDKIMRFNLRLTLDETQIWQWNLQINIGQRGYWFLINNISFHQNWFPLIAKKWLLVLSPQNVVWTICELCLNFDSYLVIGVVIFKIMR